MSSVSHRNNSLPSVQEHEAAIRRQLKEWERSFASKQGRKPTVTDIKQRQGILELYQRHKELKQQLREALTSSSSAAISSSEHDDQAAASSKSTTTPRSGDAPTSALSLSLSSLTNIELNIPLALKRTRCASGSDTTLDRQELEQQQHDDADDEEPLQSPPRSLQRRHLDSSFYLAAFFHSPTRTIIEKRTRYHEIESIGLEQLELSPVRSEHQATTATIPLPTQPLETTAASTLAPADSHSLPTSDAAHDRLLSNNQATVGHTEDRFDEFDEHDDADGQRAAAVVNIVPASIRFTVRSKSSLGLVSIGIKRSRSALNESHDQSDDDFDLDLHAAASSTRPRANPAKRARIYAPQHVSPKVAAGQQQRQPPQPHDEFQWGGANVPKRRDNFVHLKLRGGNKHRKPIKRGRTFVQSSSQYRLKARAVISDDSTDAAAADAEWDASAVQHELNHALEAQWNERPDEPSTVGASAARVHERIAEMSLEQVLVRFFGHEQFREGQRESIERVLGNQSTLLIVPTGGGKSLCYQLPALVLAERGLTLVVCPLISLMQDQMRLMPSCLSARALHSAQSAAEAERVIEAVRRREVNVLFVSPERLSNQAFVALWHESHEPMAPEPLPPIALACIDEAHCVSQWSHNFRPTYLHVAGILRKKLRVPCILAITATCSLEAESSITELLGIERPHGVLRYSPVRANLQLSASCDIHKASALLKLLKSPRFQALDSIIVYCTYKNEADTVAEMLNASGIDAQRYHAGLEPKQRQRIQDSFMSGRLRVVVATVAFGLGLNKADVRAVIHYSIPRSLENYLQEIGRAGRDGQPAFCHLFLEALDFQRLRSLCSADGIERASISRILRKLFGDDAACEPREPQPSSSGARPRPPLRYVTFAFEAESRALDMKAEVLETLLTYIQLAHPDQIELLPPGPCSCALFFHGKHPEYLANTNAFIKAVMAIGKKGERGSVVFDLAAAANGLGCNLAQLESHLEGLQHTADVRHELRDTGARVCVRTAADGEQAIDLDALLTQLEQHMAQLERCKVLKIDACYHVMSQAAFPSVDDVLSTDLREHQELEQERELHVLLERHFQGAHAALEHQHLTGWPIVSYERLLSSRYDAARSSVRELIARAAYNGKRLRSGREVARILHGLSSPACPQDEWWNDSAWASLRRVDFEALRRWATAQLRAFAIEPEAFAGSSAKTSASDSLQSSGDGDVGAPEQ